MKEKKTLQIKTSALPSFNGNDRMVAHIMVIILYYGDARLSYLKKGIR